jgi:hypothetical protein
LENGKLLIYFSGAARSVTAGGEINALPLEKIGEHKWGVAVTLPDSEGVRAKICITSQNMNGAMNDHGVADIAGPLAAKQYQQQPSFGNNSACRGGRYRGMRKQR